MAETTSIEAAAEQWREGRRRGRVVGAASVGPVQVVLRSVVERRTVRFRYERAGAEEPEGAHPEIDPWDVAVEVPAGVSEWKGERELVDRRTSTLCPRCVGGNERRARTNREGVVHYHDVPCTLCARSCRAFAIPIVEVELETVTRTRVIERYELPVELLLEIGERFDDGRRVHEERGEALRPRSAAGGGYRAAPPRVSPEVDPVIDALLVEHAEAAVEARTHEQVLEVSEVPVVRVALAGGEIGWIYQDRPWAPTRPSRVGPALRVAAKWLAFLLLGLCVLLCLVLSEGR